jgi:hypothetical protein
MTHILDVLTSWDQLLPDSDICPLVMLIALLIWLGSFAVHNSPKMQWFGVRVAFGCAFLTAVADLLKSGPTSAGEVLRIVIRGLAAGGLVLGASWISLPVLTFAYRFLQASFDFALSPFRRARSAWKARRLAIETRRQQRLAHENWERCRPERERQAREQVARAGREAEVKRVAESQAAADRKRRENAQLSCLWAFDRYSTGRGERIPRGRVQAYFDQYMSNAHSAEEVEERASQLKEILEEAGGTPGKKSAFSSLDDLAVHFQKKRLEIDALPYDEDTKETLLTSINAQEEVAIREVLRP